MPALSAPDSLHITPGAVAGLDVSAPRAVASLDVSALRAVASLDVSASRAVASLDVSAPRAVASLDALAGRLGELSGLGASCVTSFAFGLVREAQVRGEPAAWVLVRPRAGTSAEPAPFMAEDLLRLGLDLAALPFVITADLAEAGRAATHLLRSGAFALVVLDTLELEANEVELPLPLMSRLHGLALKHEAAFVVLTARPPDAPSLGSLVAFRAHIQRGRERLLAEDTGDTGDGLTRVTATLTVDKDKRRGPGLVLTRAFSGPPGFLGPTRAP